MLLTVPICVSIWVRSEFMFKENLKKLRKEQKVTQVQLASHLGFFHSAVVKWENGQCEPSFDTLVKIAQYFNVSVDYLLGITDSPYTAEDYANGVKDTKKISVTADQEDIFDKTNEVLEVLGEKGKNLIIEFCDALLEKFGK